MLRQASIDELNRSLVSSSAYRYRLDDTLDIDCPSLNVVLLVEFSLRDAILYMIADKLLQYVSRKFQQIDIVPLSLIH